MTTADFRFADELSAFLQPAYRGQRFSHRCARAATLKNAIEALGVPHTEVGHLSVNGAPATLQRAVRDGDVIEVAPYRHERSPALRFLADVHLGGLARCLRMLGCDTLHDPAWPDAEIRQLAHEENRIVLTRDRALLMCRDIAHGCYVRALKPEAQLREVAARYGLDEQARPFTLCLLCNVPLDKIAKPAVAGRVPDRVLELHDEFTHCPACGRIYWPGTHYQRMKRALADFAAV